MSDSPMQMYRLEPVADLPGILDAGRYTFLAGERIVLMVDVPEPTDSRDLSNMLQARRREAGDGND